MTLGLTLVLPPSWVLVVLVTIPMPTCYSNWSQVLAL